MIIDQIGALKTSTTGVRVQVRREERPSYWDLTQQERDYAWREAWHAVAKKAAAEARELCDASTEAGQDFIAQARVDAVTAYLSCDYQL